MGVQVSRSVCLLGMGAALAASSLLGGCEKKTYPQDTPEAAIASARKMLEDGKAEKLADLIYAENPDMRQTLVRVGRLLRDVQNLAASIQTKFPNDVAKIKEQAKSEGVTGLLSQIGGNQRRRGRAAADRDRDGAQFDGLIKQVMTDPYAWLQDNSGRLTTAPVNDNLVALLWDQKPILPPLGLGMRKDGDKWFLVLPTNLPGVSTFMPRSADEYKTFSMLFGILGNAIRDVDKDVKSGKLKTLDEVSRKVGENAFMPVAMFFIAYGKMIESRPKAPAAETKAVERAPAEPKPAGG